MTLRESKRRWFYPTPAWLVLGLLGTTGLLYWSERFGFNSHKGWTVLIAVAAVGVAFTVLLLWWIAALIFRLRFQFTIRLLLVSTVAVALPCGWLGAEMKKARQQKQAVAAIAKLGGGVGYDWQFDAKCERLPNARLPAPTWLRSLLGDDLFQSVRFVRLDRNVEEFSNTVITDAGLEQLKGLSQLQHLDLNDTQVTDAGLEHLKDLKQLQSLDLSYTQVTDAGLEHLKDLNQLQSLNLDGTQVTDSGLEHLKGFSQLQYLYLYSTEVTDAGLEHLEGLGKLHELYLGETKVTGPGVKKLQQALPNCWIHCR